MEPFGQPPQSYRMPSSANRYSRRESSTGGEDTADRWDIQNIQKQNNSSKRTLKLYNATNNQYRKDASYCAWLAPSPTTGPMNLFGDALVWISSWVSHIMNLYSTSPRCSSISSSFPVRPVPWAKQSLEYPHRCTNSGQRRHTGQSYSPHRFDPQPEGAEF